MEPRNVVLRAWSALERLHRKQLALSELPVAQLVMLTANLNRDPKKSSQPFQLQDFCLFKEDKHDTPVLPPAAAHVALGLRHEGRLPSVLLSVWQEILASVQQSAAPVEVRALASDDGAVWVLAPQWEGRNIRGGLVAVDGRVHGAVVVRDVDRQLLTYRLQVPQRKGFGWVEAGCLLLAAET